MTVTGKPSIQLIMYVERAPCILFMAKGAIYDTKKGANTIINTPLLLYTSTAINMKITVKKKKILTYTIFRLSLN